MSEIRHKGNFEYTRFEERREAYDFSLIEIEGMNLSTKELIEDFTRFTGHMSIARYIGLYELYKLSLGVAGHICEIGIYKGASLLFFAKLIKIFESESLTQVHGFDWFQGTGKDSIENRVEIGTYKSDEVQLKRLIEIQQLNRIAFVHKMDVTTELKTFLEEYKHLQFKLIFLDAGLYNVVSKVLPLLWERLTSGGILIFDQFNHELSPGETIAVREFLPNAKVRTLPNIWMPTGYIIKE